MRPLHLHGVEGHGHGSDEDVGDGERGDEEVGGLPDLAVDHEADEDEEVAEGGDHDADGQAHRDEDGQQGAEGRRPALGAAGGAVRPCKARRPVGLYPVIYYEGMKYFSPMGTPANPFHTMSHLPLTFLSCFAFKMLLGFLFIPNPYPLQRHTQISCSRCHSHFRDEFIHASPPSLRTGPASSGLARPVFLLPHFCLSFPLLAIGNKGKRVAFFRSMEMALIYG